MEDFNTSARLRNACDACHRLKRKCTGATPCENCSSSGSSCFYSVAGRLGRPPGSRSRRNTRTAKSAKARGAGLSISQAEDLANPESTNMLDLDLDFGSFDQMASYQMFMSPAQNPGSMMSMFSTIETDPDHGLEYFSALDNSTTMSPSTSGNDTPLSISPIQMPPESQQKQQKHQDNLFVQTPFSRQQQQTQPQPQSQPQRPGKRGHSRPQRCQCIPGLSSLIHDLKSAGDDGMPPAGLDDMLFRVNNALSLWSALAACPRCCGHDLDDGDDGETLLLAALSMRRVVSQFQAVSSSHQPAFLQPGTSNNIDGEAEDDDDDAAGPQVHVGSFRVTGPDRTMLLGVLRTITVRKLDAVVTAMRSMLRTKQARRRQSDVAMLQHVESIFDELSKTIKQ
ncbi:C6 zinc finger domain protein [Apiospora marii]|uniref:C6 zinc finger domain protein n=1 Tax=Apiospora marii TaxID=335849 RepID=A0ABR1RSU7_9PEZI